MHPILEDLFHAFNQTGARWCILRMPEQDQPGDIDLLVDRRDLDVVQQSLLSRGFVWLAGWSPGSHFLQYDCAGGRWLWVHVVTELSFGPWALLKTEAESGCLGRSHQYGALVRLARDDDFWVTLFHCLLDKGYIAPRHRTRLLDLCDSVLIDGQLAQFAAFICPRDWNPHRIIETVHQAKWTELERLAAGLRAAWSSKQHAWSGNRFLFSVSRFLVRLRYVRRNWGLSIAILGPDGAGKSTLIDGIMHSFPLPVRTIYMGLTGGLLRHVNRLRIPLLIIPSRFAIFWCRYLSALYHQARGRLVLFDRYVYDSAVPTPFPLSALGRVYRWIDGHSIPGPDLVILLDAPGVAMYERKGEYDPDQLENWRQHFLTLRKSLGRLMIVDATCTRECVRNQVTARVWQEYTRRMSHRLDKRRVIDPVQGNKECAAK